MTNQEILSHIDHTLLKSTASWQEIQQLCKEALQYQTASVCIPPCYIRNIREHFGADINICTVIGFPLGYQIPRVKLMEAEYAIKDGANEIDMVINLTDVKNGNFSNIQDEISAIKQMLRSHILKVIVETCYLTVPEKIQLCQIVTNSGADYIKTSTGFGPSGAVLEDIALFRQHIGPNVRIKAAGGIRSRTEMEQYLLAGCDRIGSSSAVKCLAGNS